MSSTRFIWNGWELVARSVQKNSALPAPAPDKYYTWGLDLSDSIGGAGFIGGLLAVSSDELSAHYFASSDSLGNVVAIANTSDASDVMYTEYGPFGDILRDEDRSLEVNEIRYSSKYFDSETELSYFGLRYYDAAQGRFINRDPLSEPGGYNLYRDFGFESTNPIYVSNGIGGLNWLDDWASAQAKFWGNGAPPHSTDGIRPYEFRNSADPVQVNRHARAIGSSIDVNLYAYVRNQPWTSVDPLGLTSSALDNPNSAMGQLIEFNRQSKPKSFKAANDLQALIKGGVELTSAFNPALAAFELATGETVTGDKLSKVDYALAILPGRVGKLRQVANISGKANQTKKAAVSMTEGLDFVRLPKSNGSWSGDAGNSLWKSNKPDVVAILDQKGMEGIPFVGGLPDFSKFSELTFEVSGLTGKNDTARILNALKKKFDMKTQQDVKDFLMANNLVMHHHFDGKHVMLVDKAINDIPHSGGAAILRSRGDGR